MNGIKTRSSQILIVLILLMIVLFIRLAVLTIIQNDYWIKASNNLSTKNIVTPAPRGEIRDRYGRLVAGNLASFDVQMSTNGIDTKEVNRIILKTIKILERNGDGCIDNLPIIINNGKFEFTYDNEIQDWLASEDMPANYTAKQAFSELRERFEIPSKTSDFDAQKILQEKYSVYPPISVKSMKYTKELEKQSFLGKYHLDRNTIKKDLDARQAFDKLCENFKISREYGDETARKILIVRNETSVGFLNYIPATIASGISNESIITLKENSNMLAGVHVVSESKRFYPYGEVGAHAIGYLGQISENQKEEYINKKKYNPNQLIGKDGIEREYEDILKGKDGVKKLQVNAKGQMVRVLEETKPKKGSDVYLTVDMELEKTMVESLNDTLRTVRAGSNFQSKYGSYKMKQAPGANVAAAVAIDPKTGEIMGIASTPSFNPNLFSKGISADIWKSLQPENERDSLAPRPLFNVATKTAVQPGSTFKPVTATAALESGLSPNRKIYADGAVEIGNRTFGCWLWNTKHGKHGYINLPQAIEMSCNYFFYDLVANKDFYHNSYLGLDKSMGVKKVTEYAKQYGLGEPTGIEIPEVVTSVPTEESKKESIKNLLKNYLYSKGEIYFGKKVFGDSKAMDDKINQILGWTEENPSFKVIKDSLKNLGVKEKYLGELSRYIKYDCFSQAKWTVGDSLNIAIGQGDNSFTPVQMANYVATIANRGDRYKVRLVKDVQGSRANEPELVGKVDVKNSNTYDAVIKGMIGVGKGSKGSLKGVFGSFPMDVICKTGTAQRAGKIPVKDEVEYIRKNLGRIAPGISWSAVEEKMNSLMKEKPKIFRTQNTAIRQALITLSNGKITSERIDAYKGTYEPFAWVIAAAPAKDPKIAVAVLVFQGGTAGNAGPCAREIIGRYFELQNTYAYKDYIVTNRATN